MSSAVDNLADNLATTSIQEPTTTADAGTNGASDAVLASAAEGRRLYIGNLAYATTEGELKEFFKDFQVEDTSIPVNPRTNRPVGYAFVDLPTADEAQKAIAELSGKEILERKVSVQLARNPAEQKTEAASGGEGSGAEGRKRGSARGRGRARGRGGRVRGGRKAEGATEDAAETTLPDGVVPLTEDTNGAPAATEAKEAKARAPRAPRQRGPPEDGVASKTKVMVANLPYDLTEEKLKELFSVYDPVSAKIALRPIPRFMVKKLQARGEARKGRGFGFVTLASEELQQKAVSEMNGKEIEGREIAVKVAIDSPGKEDGKEDVENAEPAAETAPVEETPVA